MYKLTPELSKIIKEAKQKYLEFGLYPRTTLNELSFFNEYTNFIGTDPVEGFKKEIAVLDFIYKDDTSKLKFAGIKVVVDHDRYQKLLEYERIIESKDLTNGVYDTVSDLMEVKVKYND
ncbi:hypothetical protein ACJQWY_02315 [Weissella kandleri]|uniref:hypothetical protein n=1 Tax=Weissella kandleri TaxID=1616 RepID=UPI00387E4D5B